MPASSPEAKARKNAANAARKKAKLAEVRRLENEGKPLDERQLAIKESAKLKNQKKEVKKADKKGQELEVAQRTVENLSKTSPQKDFPNFDLKTFKGPQPRTLSNFPNTINEDSTHHDAITEAGSHLSDALRKAHESGKVPSTKETTDFADISISSGFSALSASQNAHENGDINSAKEHMDKAAKHFGLATSAMENKGILGNSAGKIKLFIKGVANSYVKSSVPGFGAAPHKDFVTPKETPKVSSNSEISEDSWKQTRKKINKADKERDLNSATKKYYINKNVIESTIDDGKNVYNVSFQKEKKPSYAKPDIEDITSPSTGKDKYGYTEQQHDAAFDAAHEHWHSKNSNSSGYRSSQAFTHPAKYMDSVSKRSNKPKTPKASPVVVTQGPVGAPSSRAAHLEAFNAGQGVR
jgi:hypothetical protein